MTGVFDIDDIRERRAVERAQARAAAAHTPEIAECQLCDDDGYRRPELTTICDHIDHRPAYRAGMAAVRAVLQKGPQQQ